MDFFNFGTFVWKSFEIHRFLGHDITGDTMKTKDEVITLLMTQRSKK